MIRAVPSGGGGGGGEGGHVHDVYTSRKLCLPFQILAARYIRP